jgi:putative transposase
VTRGLIERAHPKLSMGAQCQLLSILQSSFYCAPQDETALNLDVMLKVDRQYLDTPIYGVRQMTWHLQSKGYAVNEKRIRRLMRSTQIYQKPNTSNPTNGHKAYPFLLGRLRIDRSNQVRCADIIYSLTCKGFLYLVAVIDWFIRKVLVCRISNTHQEEFCIEAPKEAIHKFGPPEIMNPYQGSQFTFFDLIDQLERAETKISMESKARYLDNIFTERLWDPRNTNASTCASGKPGHRQAQASDAGSHTTIISGPMPPMAANRPPWSTSTYLKPTSMCRQ